MAPAFSLDTLHESIATRFDEAQNSIVNHRKNCVGLYNTHLQAARVTNQENDGEEIFITIFITLLSRVMDVKKGSCPDRIVKFVASYVKFIHEKAKEEPKNKGKGAASASTRNLDADEDDTLASRFASRLLEWLLQGFQGKNKLVRLRAVTIVAETMAHIGEMDADTYEALRDGLTDRICDKEPSIRAQAVAALSKLVGTEDPSELKKGEKTILEMVLGLLCHDPAAEVRRAALISVPVTAESLDAILTRTRDVDPITRKIAYSSVLCPKLQHPQQLTISQREEIIKAGLGDREPAVRAAVGKLIENWFDIAVVEAKEDGEDENQPSWQGDDGGAMKAFIHFLSWFDVVGPGEEVAVDGILSVFTTRPSICEQFAFPDDYWQELTAESAVLARAFLEHCLTAKNQDALEKASLPVITAFALLIQDVYNELLQLLQDVDLLGLDDDEDGEAREEALAKKEVVLGELLRMALKLDYMDEVGRQKVFSVIKEMLAQPHLPQGLIPRALDLMREIVPSERDLIRIVVEIIIDLREGYENGDELDENERRERSMRRAKQADQMTDEEKKEADVTDMRCLNLCIGMLERVNGTFEDNSTLEGMLTDLIIPAVKRKELGMREKGLVALGLCCLIAKNMALNSFQLFFNQVQNAPEDLMLKVLQVIFDLLIMYEQEFLGRSEEVSEQILTFLLQILDSAESDRIQALVCVGLSKLLLCGLVTDKRVLTSLILTYISPSVKDNAELTQCLSYFFPVYCYSSAENQDRVRQIFMEAYDRACEEHEQLDDEQDMIAPYQFGQLLVDWTNPAKASYKSAEQSSCHSSLCIDLLLALFDSERTDQKVLCQFIDQLLLTAEWKNKSSTVVKISVLLDQLDQQRPYDDQAADKVLNRFKIRFAKLFAEQVENVDLRQYVDEEFGKLYEAIGLDLPDADSETPQRVRIPYSDKTMTEDVSRISAATNDSTIKEEDTTVASEIIPPPPVTPMKKPTKRRAAARTPAAKTASPPRKKRAPPKPKAKSRRKAQSDDDDSESDEDAAAPTKPVLQPTQPTRRSTRAAPRKTIYVEEPDEDEEEEEEAQSDDSVPAKPARRGRRGKMLGS